MKAERLAVTRGKGNVYRDLGKENADLKQFKALLAAEIIRTLDRDQLSVCGSCPHGNRGGGLFPHPQRGSWALYGRSADVDHQPSGGQSEASRRRPGCPGRIFCVISRCR
jgi:hypothetical protein